MSWGKIFSARNIASVAAAPFTGGASLAFLNNGEGKSLIGDFTGANQAEKANRQNVEMQNYWNNKNIELANTAHQREMADLEAAGINPMLAGLQGAATPALESATVNNTMPGGYMAQIAQGAGIMSTLAQAKAQMATSGMQQAQENAINLDTSIKHDLKPTTIKQAEQNLENSIAENAHIQAMTNHSAQQALTEVEKRKEIKAATKYTNERARGYSSSSGAHILGSGATETRTW